jgi:hypothetical protein
MAKQRSRVAQIFENAVDTLGSATASTGSRVKEGLDKAADAVADSGAVEQIVAKTATARKVGANKIGDAKKRSPATAKKTAGVKKQATKKTAGVKKQAAKKTAGVKKAGRTRRA